MLIECPDCAARYQVPDDRLAPGRPVRCARCGQDWTPVPAIVEPASVQPAPAPAEPPSIVIDTPEIDTPAIAEPPARPRPVHPFLIPPRVPASYTPEVPAAPEPPPSRAGLTIAWVLSLAVLVAVAWIVIEFRGPITRAWPPSIRAYDALSLSIAGR